MIPRILSKALVSTCFAMLLAAAAYAQPGSLTVHGKILDGSGAPVSGAMVAVKGTSLHATTGEDGSFTLEFPSAGAYVLTLGRIGYAPQQSSIQVPAETEQTFTLVAAPLPMKPVDVHGSWSLTRAKGFALPMDDLSGDRLRNGATVSLAQAIEGLAGVHNLHTGQQIGKPVIRGMTGPRVLTLDDGMRLEDYSWSEEDGPSVDARLADRVEVVRGPASVLYGSDALGGVVNAIPRSVFAESEERTGKHFGYEAYGSSNNIEFGGAFLAEKREMKSGWRVFLVGRKAEDFKTPDGKLENTGYGAGNGEAMFGKRGDRNSFTARYARYGGEFKLLEAGDSTGGGGEEGGGPERKAGDDRVQLSFTQLAGGLNLEARGQWQHHSLIEVADSMGVKGTESEQFNLGLNTISTELLAHHGHGRVQGTLGLSGRTQKNDTKGPEPLVPDADVKAGGAFLLERFEFGKLAILAGGRGDFQEIHAESNADLGTTEQKRDYRQLSGSAGAVYQLSGGCSLRGNVGRAWRAPTLFELFTNGPHLAESQYEIGDSTLSPEGGVEFDAGLRVDRARFRGELSGFYSKIQDFIYIAPTGAFVGPLRVFRHQQADATLKGGEASADVKAGGNVAVHARLDYTRGQNDDLDEPLPLIPPLHGVFGLSRAFDSGSTRAGAELEFASRQTELSPDDVPTAGYALFNLEGGFQPKLGGMNLRVDLRVHNVLDQPYRDYLSRYKEFALDPGRNVTVRVSSGI